jgi:hypothetical protein
MERFGRMSKKDPIIDDKQFFAALDEIEIVRRESNSGYPWQHVMEDRAAAEDCIASLYKKHSLNPPRAYSWARSPRAMWGAIKLMRQFQTESRQNVVAGLIPMGDPVETEAKRVMMDTIMDRTLTVTLGGNLSNIFRTNLGTMRRSLEDLKEILNLQMEGEHGLGRGQRAPMFAEMVLWPISNLPGFHNLKCQALVIAPFTHVCFLSRPPKYIKTNLAGRLHCTDGPAVLFEDGYEVWAAQTEQTALPDNKVLELPAPEESE